MRILVAIDGSASGEAAIEAVASRPWPPESEIRVVTVDPPMDPSLLRGGSPTYYDELVQQHRDEAVQRLRAATSVLRQKVPDLFVTSSLLEGWPKEAIVAEAERWKADLLVVGSHGYGPIRRFFLGSVSLYAAMYAPCSVEIVRSPQRSAETNAT